MNWSERITLAELHHRRTPSWRRWLSRPFTSEDRRLGMDATTDAAAEIRDTYGLLPEYAWDLDTLAERLSRAMFWGDPAQARETLDAMHERARELANSDAATGRM